jgi:hypothetical protein
MKVRGGWSLEQDTLRAVIFTKSMIPLRQHSRHGTPGVFTKIDRIAYSKPRLNLILRGWRRLFMEAKLLLRCRLEW